MRVQKIHVIGIDPCNSASIPAELIRTCRMVVATRRFVEPLKAAGILGSSQEVVSISPLDMAFGAIARGSRHGDVAVLASGDPLFYGIGRRLIETFGPQNVLVYPAVSSVQHTFARFGISWENASFISLHGRPMAQSLARILMQPLSAVLTDQRNRPENIAREILSHVGENSDRYLLHVAENLGTLEERCVTGTLEQIADQAFGHLCCLLIVRQHSETTEEPPWQFGLTEDMVCHSRGLITKNEVRAAILHALAIPRQALLWDVGAGSGSVGLELARMHNDLLVYAIERDSEQQHNIRQNIRKYDTMNMRLICGAAPDALHGLPSPDRIFIGGSGGNLKEIIEASVTALRPDGRIVVSAVLAATAETAPQLLHQLGLSVQISRIAVERSVYPNGDSQRFNPITIINGIKRTAVPS